MSRVTMTIEEVQKLMKRERGAKRAERIAEDKTAAEARRASYRVSTEPVSFRLPFPPPLNRYYREYPVRTKSGKWIVTKSISKGGMNFRRAVIDQWQRDIRITFDAGLRLAIKIVAVFPDNRAYDLDGLWKATLDALEKAGAYASDEKIKAESMEQNRVKAPGWLDITLGPKPGERQGTLFEIAW